MADSSANAVGDLAKRLSAHGLQLRAYQRDGVEFLLDCKRSGHGALLADEMGLGKTCQSVCALSAIGGERGPSRAALVVCPLSVADAWMREIERFGHGLHATLYRGDADERDRLRQCIEHKRSQVVLTTFETILKDVEYFAEQRWSSLVVDEAHRLKNTQSQVHQAVASLHRDWTLLLTGTPVHNNLGELYALLALAAPHLFPPDEQPHSADGDKADAAACGLRERLAKVMLRRTKGQVCAELPQRADALIYADLAPLQRTMYKAILAKNHSMFEQVASSSGKQSLLNALAQLRKCVNHPYLFPGVEPEPFVEGEHLVTSSGKLFILDHLLSYLRARSHRVLLFSQSTMMLDVLQDYMALRGYVYERLDGSVRSEERFAAVRSFNADRRPEGGGAFVFLLSTRAGGLGLTLTGADTVVFYDSDFNPQVDMQAAARAHRIGQTKPVRTIRLVARHTVDEVIAARANAKLRLCESIIDNDESLRATEMGSVGQDTLRRMLTAGLSALQAAGDEAELSAGSEQCKGLHDVFTASLGETDDDGCWLPVKSVAQEEASASTLTSAETSIYYFDGQDYRNAQGAVCQRGNSEADLDALKAIGSQHRAEAANGRAAANVAANKKAELSTEQIAEREQKAAERAHDRELRKAERNKKFWQDNDYTSSNLAEPPAEDNGATAPDDQTEHGGSMHFVLGDVTRPECDDCDANTDMAVVHVVDDSGTWGTGGLFDALRGRFENDVIPEAYGHAKGMRDLHLGDAHLVFDGRPTAAVLCVAQSAKRRDTINYKALEQSLSRVAHWCKGLPYAMSVHVARIGYGLANVQWYSVERLLRKQFCQNAALPVYVYYFDRRGKRNDGSDEPERKRVRVDESTSSIDVDAKASGMDESLFAGVGVHLRTSGGGSAPAAAVRLMRMAAACGADVLDAPQRATHVVVAGDAGADDDRQCESSTAVVVQLGWLEDCLKQGRLLSTQSYVCARVAAENDGK